jgi:hypothetical protein
MGVLQGVLEGVLEGLANGIVLMRDRILFWRPLRSSGSTAFAMSDTAPRTLMCSFLSSSNDSSRVMCQGYKTKTWKPRADEATAKLVMETRRVRKTMIAVVSWGKNKKEELGGG